MCGVLTRGPNRPAHRPRRPLVSLASREGGGGREGGRDGRGEKAEKFYMYCTLYSVQHIYSAVPLRETEEAFYIFKKNSDLIHGVHSIKLQIIGSQQLNSNKI